MYSYTIISVSISDAREKSLIYKGLREIEQAVPCVKFTEYRNGDSRVPNTHIRLVKRG